MRRIPKSGLVRFQGGRSRVTKQKCRHAFIAGLLGIRYVVVTAVNKMHLGGWLMLFMPLCVMLAAIAIGLVWRLWNRKRGSTVRQSRAWRRGRCCGRTHSRRSRICR